jgi:hypothetical protein
MDLWDSGLKFDKWFFSYFLNRVVERRVQACYRNVTGMLQALTGTLQALIGKLQALTGML